MEKKIGVLIVAYNAVNTLAKVLDRIPDDVREKIAEVFVFDDCSTDDTYLLGVGYKETRGWDKLKLFRNAENLGYGGNQKRGYRYAIDNGFDIVVLLHGDGQYAPECMGTLLEPLEKGEAEAVFGSRLLDKGAARRGGMPRYKLLGNKILTRFENAALGMNLSEFHSGYRAYDVHALAKIPFEKNTDDFHFDTEIIIQLHQHKMRIVEKPIPTYYGDEICHVDGLKYAANVARSVARYRFQQAGFRSYPNFAQEVHYPIKRDKYSSHVVIGKRIQGKSPRVLDVGCGPGNVAALLNNESFEYVGVDYRKPEDLHPNVGVFHEKDLEKDFDLDYGREFDYVVFGDILEHLREPAKILEGAHRYLKPGGQIIVSVPNILHWSVRLMVLTGHFVYMDRGILDKTHLRFFTRKIMTKLLCECGFEPIEVIATPVPLSTIAGRWAESRWMRMLATVQNTFANLWKNLFAYQLIFVARELAPEASRVGDAPAVAAADAKVSEPIGPMRPSEPTPPGPSAHAPIGVVRSSDG